jgi:ParB-like chromosome segregation protein Spo0J
MIHESLQHLAVSIDTLIEDPNNARLHNADNMSAVRKSLSTFGQRLPIVVQKKGMVVRAGNARLAAARELGWTQIAALVLNDNDTEAVAYALADNRTAELSWFDKDALANVLRAVMASADDLISATGFDIDEVLQMTAEEQATAESHVKMIQLFLDTESSPRFQAACEKLAQRTGAQTLSDVVLAAVESQYAQRACN